MRFKADTSANGLALFYSEFGSVKILRFIKEKFLFKVLNTLKESMKNQKWLILDKILRLWMFSIARSQQQLKCH